MQLSLANIELDLTQNQATISSNTQTARPVSALKTETHRLIQLIFDIENERLRHFAVPKSKHNFNPSGRRESDKAVLVSRVDKLLDELQQKLNELKKQS